VTPRHPGRLIRRDPVALRTAILGDPLPFLLRKLRLIAGLDTAELCKAGGAGNSGNSSLVRFVISAKPILDLDQWPCAFWD
jgi:hypothetical protein